MFKTVRLLQFLIVVLALALAAPVFADSYTRTVTLTAPAKLGGAELKPGDYRLEFNGSKVILKQGKQVMAEAPAEWVEIKYEVSGDSVVIEKGAISEIRIAGKKRMIKVH